jgi:transposase
VICLDEMGPESAKTFAGQELVRVPEPEATPPHTDPPAPPPPPPMPRATQEIDYGRRGKGYVFGAFQPATGEAFTHPYASRSTVNWVDFLTRVDEWLPGTIGRVYAIEDNLSMHRAVDVLLFAVAHPRWEFVFQPKYAAYLNLIEPWWKVLRSLALKGRRFESWDDICAAVRDATAYWNQHRHPFLWGHRRRHRIKRVSGIAVVPCPV